jgi:hypothetical protein
MDPELTPFRTLSTLIDHVNDKVKHG